MSTGIFAELLFWLKKSLIQKLIFLKMCSLLFWNVNSSKLFITMRWLEKASSRQAVVESPLSLDASGVAPLRF